MTQKSKHGVYLLLWLSLQIVSSNLKGICAPPSNDSSVKKGSVAVTADDLSAKLDKAENLINSHKPKAAATILREVIRKNPNNADAHMQMGAVLAAQVENDKFEPAIAEEQLALKLDPNSYGARKILGKIYANQHKLDESIAILKEAVSLKPNSYGAYRDLGTVYATAGKTDDAISSFKKAVEYKPESLEVHMKLAILFSKNGKYPEAIAEAKEAVKHGGKRAETHLTLANILLESGDSAASITPFKDAIAANGYDSLGCLNPLTMANALSGLGWAMASPKDASAQVIAEAVQKQRKAIKAFPGFLTAHLRLTELFARQNKFKEAESNYLGLMKATRSDGAVATSYAKFLDSWGRRDDARKMLKQVLEKTPNYKPASEALYNIESKPK